MGSRIERAIDDIDRMEQKLLLIQNQKKEAQARLKLVENEEIIRTIRQLKLGHRQLASLLDGLNEGTVSFSDVQAAVEENGTENHTSDASSIQDSNADMDGGNTSAGTESDDASSEIYNGSYGTDAGISNKTDYEGRTGNL